MPLLSSIRVHVAQRHSAKQKSKKKTGVFFIYLNLYVCVSVLTYNIKNANKIEKALCSCILRILFQQGLAINYFNNIYYENRVDPSII